MADRIFISYSHFDLGFVRWLREELRKRGYDIWFDSNSIQIGQIWREEIVQGIEESDYFMIIISSRSVQSANVVKELSLAESFGKTILPIMIENVKIPSKMKYQLAGVQFIILNDTKSEENLDLLVEGLRNQAIASGRDSVASLLLHRGYELGDCMGESERSTTYRMKDQKRAREVVLKIYPTSGSMVQKFQAEARRLEALRYQGFPIILDHFEQQGCYCLIQEFIDGTPWSAIHWTHEMITLHARKILSLLSVMHDRGIVHADIRPNNLLLLTGKQDSSIVDLSLVQTALLMKQTSPPSLIKKRETQPLQKPQRSFTRGFFQAPEFTRFSVLNPAIDLYALGVTILVLCSGQDPDTLYEQSVGQWLMRGVEEPMRRWLAPMLIDSPSERVQHAEQVLALMDADSGSIPQASKQEPVLSESTPLLLLSALNSDDLQGDQKSTSSPSIEDQQQPAKLPSAPSLPEQILPETPSIGYLSTDQSNRRWCRNRLLDSLLLRIGPIAENLLQEWSEDLNEVDQEALRRSFAAIGIDPLILDECMSQASMNSKDLADKTPAATDPSPPQAPAPMTSSLLDWLRDEVGPIANILWDARLEEELKKNPDQARWKLEQTGVNSDVIEKLLQRVAKTEPTETLSEPGLGSNSINAPEPAPTAENYRDAQNNQPGFLPESNQAQSLQEEQLKAVLLDLLGPMAHSLIEEVASIPQVEERVKRLLGRLSQLGISAELIETLQSRLKPWSYD